MKRYAAGILCACALSAGSLVHAAETRITIGVDRSTGDYGQPVDTDITYIPVTGTYRTDTWMVRLTVPYLRISGPATVIPDVGVIEEEAAPTRTDSGLGDIVLSLTREIYASRTMLLDATGKIKFPTADEGRGLGTGETDYSFQVDGYVPVDRTTTFGTLGYRIFGDPPDIELDNVWFGSLGFSHPLTERLSGGAIFDWRQRSNPAGHPRRELTLFAASRINPDWSLQGYGVRGFTDGSPDWALGLMMVYRGRIFARERLGE
jgi:hypothetical protein